MNKQQSCIPPHVSAQLTRPFRRLASLVSDAVLKSRRLSNLRDWNGNPENWKNYNYLPMRGLVADFNYVEHLLACRECGIDLPGMKIAQTFRRCHPNWKSACPTSLAEVKSPSQTFLLHLRVEQDHGNTQGVLVEITSETVGSKTFQVAQIRGILRPSTVVRYRPRISKGV